MKNEFARGFALKLLLEKLGKRVTKKRPKGGRRRRRSESRTPRTPQPAPRGPLFALMLASGGIAVPLMIIFDSPITRIVGVLGLFAFIVAGVFVIADPAFLEQEESA